MSLRALFRELKEAGVPPEALQHALDNLEIQPVLTAHPTEAKRIANSEIARLSGKALNGQVLDEAWERMEVTYDPVSASLRGSADRAYQVGLLGKEKPQLDGCSRSGRGGSVCRKR